MAFNLFDFSKNTVGSSISPLMGTTPKAPQPSQVGGATGGGVAPPTMTRQPLPRTPVKQSVQPNKSGILDSLIPKASAAEFDENDIVKFKDLLSKGIAPDRAKALILQAKGIQEPTTISSEQSEGQPKEREQGFLEKTGRGLLAAPEAAFEGLTGLATGAARKVIGEEKFKKEGEIGNLGLPVGKQESATTNVLKTTKGLTGSAFTVAAPVVATTLSGVGATKYGGMALGAIGDLIHKGGELALNQIPTLKNLTIEQKNDFTDTLVNAFGVRSATKGVGGKSGAIKKLDAHPGVTLKELGSGIVDMFYAKSKGTADAMQNYRAGLSPKKPITIGDVAGEFKITGGKKQMGADARVAKQNLWEKEIAPNIKNTRTVVKGEELMNSVKPELSKIVEPTQRAALDKAFKQIGEQYKGKTFSAEELANLKSTLQAKTMNVTETSAARSQIMEMLAKQGRKTLIETVKKDTGKDITNSMFKYGALDQLAKYGKEAESTLENMAIRGSAGAGGAVVRIVDALSSVITPIATTTGGFLYRLGNGLEFIGPKGLKTVTDLLKNSENIRIKNPQVLMNILQEPIPSPLIKGPIKQVPSPAGSLYKLPTPKGKIIPPSPKKPTVNVKKYAEGLLPEIPRIEAPKGPSLYGKGKAPVDSPRAR